MYFSTWITFPFIAWHLLDANIHCIDEYIFYFQLFEDLSLLWKETLGKEGLRANVKTFCSWPYLLVNTDQFTNCKILKKGLEGAVMQEFLTWEIGLAWYTWFVYIAYCNQAVTFPDTDTLENK